MASRRSKTLDLFERPTRARFVVGDAYDPFAGDPGSWGAVFGGPDEAMREDGESQYRYLLWHNWGKDPSNRLLWVMLNPSTATELKPDRTVSKCIEYAKKWGFDSIEVANIFAYRSTDPEALTELVDPVGRHNDDAIRIACSRATKVVGGWGAWGRLIQRGGYVARMISEIQPLNAVAMTKEGHPGHPLYLSGDLKPFHVEVRGA